MLPLPLGSSSHAMFKEHLNVVNAKTNAFLIMFLSSAVEKVLNSSTTNALISPMLRSVFSLNVVSGLINSHALTRSSRVIGRVDCIIANAH